MGILKLVKSHPSLAGSELRPTAVTGVGLYSSKIRVSLPEAETVVKASVLPPGWLRRCSLTSIVVLRELGGKSKIL